MDRSIGRGLLPAAMVWPGPVLAVDDRVVDYPVGLPWDNVFMEPAHVPDPVGDEHGLEVGVRPFLVLAIDKVDAPDRIVGIPWVQTREVSNEAIGVFLVFRLPQHPFPGS